MMILLIVSRKHALDAQFLCRDALRRTNSRDQRKVREALVTSPKHDRQNRALKSNRRLQRRYAGILAQPLQQVLKFCVQHLPYSCLPSGNQSRLSAW